MSPFDPNVSVISVSQITQLSLGRAESNEILLQHPAVSLHHARLEQKSEQGWWVYDLDSDRGTFVNNQRVGPEGLPVCLDQDTLWIAPFALRLSVSNQTTSPQPTHLRLDIVNLKRWVHSRVLLNLEGTPLSFRPGEFIAIVGGSGAGKSTLLKALMGMDTIAGSGRSGDVYFNNQLLVSGSRTESFEPMSAIIGYVPQQDDSLHYQLSAREILDFTTRLRFARDVETEERWERIEQALESVKLDRPDLQTKQIANLSGGQRKRVNVAAELVTDPRILFLDEPTSGLDPGLDLEVMRLLKSWTEGTESGDPKTIVLITHATENVRLCDTIVFLGRIRIDEQESGGCLIYYGPPGETVARFFGCQTFSEVYQQMDHAEQAGQLHNRLVSDPNWSRHIWERSRTGQDVQQLAQQASAQARPAPKIRIPIRQSVRQFGILAVRYWLLLRRDRSAFVFQLLQGALVAFLLWVVAATDSFSISGIRTAPTALLILCIAASWLGILNASKEIVKERRIFGRERRYGVRAIPYVLSKFFVLGALGIWQIATLILLTLAHIPLVDSTGEFGRATSFLAPVFTVGFEWFITLELLLLAGIAMGLLISAVSHSLDQATMLMFPAMLIQIVLSGFLFDVGPLSWLSFTYWGMRAVGISIDLERLFSIAGKASDPILKNIDFAGTGWTLIFIWLVLAGWIAGLIGLTCLRQAGKDKARIPED